MCIRDSYNTFPQHFAKINEYLRLHGPTNLTPTPGNLHPYDRTLSSLFWQVPRPKRDSRIQSKTFLKGYL